MLIDLYFIRHGIAVERQEGVPDDDRPLTPKGRKKTEAVAQQLKRLGLEFTEILTSPLIRAGQTAEILIQAGLAPRVSMTSTLAPEGSFADWMEWIKDYRKGHAAKEAALALVGHEPDLSQWAELLLWGEVRGAIALKKAGIIGLSLPPNIDPVGNSVLFWLTPPKFLLLS